MKLTRPVSHRWHFKEAPVAVVYLVLYLIAAICFLLSAVPVAQERPALLPLGLFFFVLVFVLKAALSLH